MIEAVDFALLGTVVRVQVGAAPWRAPRRAANAVLEEMRHLSQVFNVFESTSEISRYRETGESDDDRLNDVIALAALWKERTNGRFDPFVSGSLDLNGIAKGWIVDRAAVVARRVDDLVIDAGGDVLHRGRTPVRIGIEDPSLPFDNVAPICVVAIVNAAIATSGNSRRPGHLRTSVESDGSECCASASIVAADAATADALATACAVAPPDEALALAAAAGVAAMVVTASGAVQDNAAWRALLA